MSVLIIPLLFIYLQSLKSNVYFQRGITRLKFIWDAFEKAKPEARQTLARLSPEDLNNLVFLSGL